MKLTNRQSLKALTAEMDVLNEEGNKALLAEYELGKKRNRVYAQIILKEQMLSGSWHISSAGFNLQLEAIGCMENFGGLQELLSPEYHEVYPLWGEGGALLLIDDNIPTLKLDHKLAIQFIKDHGIIVDLTNLVENCADLRIKLATATELVATMKAMVSDEN